MHTMRCMSGGRSTRIWERGLAPAALILALAFLSAPGAQAVTLPPELTALEQRMTQLHVSSERFSALLVGFCAPHPGPNGCDGMEGSTLLLAVSGTISSSPRLGVFHIHGGDRKPSVQVRLVGDTVYDYRPKVARFDGGRPWVRRAGFKADDLFELDPTGLLGDALGGSLGNYGHLIGLLGKAQGVVNAGSALVVGQQTTEFDATFDDVQPILEERTGTLKLFLAASGLPVRSVLTSSAPDFYTLRLAITTPAINVPPVHVRIPPARRTIDEASLERLEARSKRKRRQ